jgi:hypothetical protein
VDFQDAFYGLSLLLVGIQVELVAKQHPSSIWRWKKSVTDSLGVQISI